LQQVTALGTTFLGNLDS